MEQTVSSTPRVEKTGPEKKCRPKVRKDCHQGKRSSLREKKEKRGLLCGHPEVLGPKDSGQSKQDEKETTGEGR